MSIQLYLISKRDEVVPILWDAAAGELPAGLDAQGIRSLNDMDIARDCGVSNRSRSITIVDNRDAARMVALIERDSHNSEVAISRLSDDVWAVGATWKDGTYDSGIPLIIDARIDGEPLELDLEEGLLEEASYLRLSETNGLDFLEITADEQPAPSFG